MCAHRQLDAVEKEMSEDSAEETLKQDGTSVIHSGESGHSPPLHWTSCPEPGAVHSFLQGARFPTDDADEDFPR